MNGSIPAQGGMDLENLPYLKYYNGLFTAVYSSECLYEYAMACKIYVQ